MSIFISFEFSTEITTSLLHMSKYEWIWIMNILTRFSLVHSCCSEKSLDEEKNPVASVLWKQSEDSKENWYQLDTITNGNNEPVQVSLLSLDKCGFYNGSYSHPQKICDSFLLLSRSIGWFEQFQMQIKEKVLVASWKPNFPLNLQESSNCERLK